MTANPIRHSSFPRVPTKKAAGRNLRLNSFKLGLTAVVADCLDRAAFLGFLATRFLVGIFRLLVDEGITAVIVPFEIVRRGFAAQIAIDALIVDEEFSARIFGIFICYISHKKNLVR